MARETSYTPLTGAALEAASFKRSNDEKNIRDNPHEPGHGIPSGKDARHERATDANQQNQG